MNDRPSILITGGAGYIGSHCCSHLHKAGFQPITYDNLSTGRETAVQWGPLIVGDIRNTKALESAIRAHNISAVMHFAAASSVGESMVDPAKYYSNNVAGTLSLLTAMQTAGCANLVFSSTGAVYGEAASGLVGESFPCNPISPYGRSKRSAEQMIIDFEAASRLRSISLRYFNACGAEVSGRIGEMRDPETHLIPCAMMKLQGHVDEFALYGEDYQTPDGTAIRDYIHVMDLADAHLLALKRLLGGASGGTFNLGTGVGHSVRQVLAMIEQITFRRLLPVKRRRRPGDPATLVADPAAAISVLGFSPRYSQLEGIVSSAWAWHQRAHPLVARSVGLEPAL